MQVGQGLQHSKATSDDTLPPAKPSVLNLPKYYHQLGTRYSNAGDFEGHSYANHLTLNMRHHSSLLGCMCVLFDHVFIPQLLIHCSKLLAVAASTPSPFLTFQKSMDYFLLLNSLLSSLHPPSCSFKARPLSTPNYCHFPSSDVVNLLSIFLQALLAHQVFETYAITLNLLLWLIFPSFTIIAGFSKSLMPDVCSIWHQKYRFSMPVYH